MKKPQNFSNWSDSDFDPSNKPRFISVEWWNENYVAPVRKYRERYRRMTQEEKEREWRSYPDSLLNPGCTLYWFSWAQDPSILEVEEEEETKQEDEVPAEYLAKLIEQLRALRGEIVLPEVPSDISATRSEAEANRIMAELEASRRAVFDKATQELWKAFEATVPGTKEWEAQQMQVRAGSTIGTNDQSNPGIRKAQLRNYFNTQMRPSDFALGAVALGALPDLYDPGAVAPGVQMIYQCCVSPEYWDITPNMYICLSTDGGAIAFLEDVLEGKVVVHRVKDDKNKKLPISTWTDDEWSALSAYVNEWKTNVWDFQRLCPGERIPEATARNKKISEPLKSKTNPFHIEPRGEDIIRQHNPQLYESVNQIVEKVVGGESLPPEATRKQQLLYEYYRSYYYYKVGSEGLPGFEIDDVPERKITPEEVIDSLMNNQNSIPGQSNLPPEDINIELVSVHDFPLSMNVLDTMLNDIWTKHSNKI